MTHRQTDTHTHTHRHTDMIGSRDASASKNRLIFKRIYELISYTRYYFHDCDVFFPSPENFNPLTIIMCIFVINLQSFEHNILQLYFFLQN